MRDTINVPIAIPAWSLIVMLGGALFTAGTLYNKMDSLIESSKHADERIAIIGEKQVGALAAIANLQQATQNHEMRITNVERALFENQKTPRR